MHPSPTHLLTMSLHSLDEKNAAIARISNATGLDNGTIQGVIKYKDASAIICNDEVEAEVVSKEDERPKTRC